MSKMRFAIIGSGAIVSTHAQAIRNMGDAVLVAIYGRSTAKVGELAGQYHCTGYTDLAAMLSRDDIDVVTVCTPNGTHAALGKTVAQAHKHVLIEKPIAISLEQADDLIKTCQIQGVKLGIIFQRRFSDGVVALKKLLAQDKLGKLLYGGCYIKLYRNQEYYDSAAWRGTWDLDGGGVLMNQGIHYIDMLQYLMGDIAGVGAQCGTYGHQGLMVEDTAVANIKFCSGALGVIEGTTCAYPGLVSRIDIYGTQGTAVIENDVLISVQLKSGYIYKAESNIENAGISSPAIASEFHQRQFQDMIMAINGNINPAITGQEGRKSLEIILAIYQAAWTGRPISLPLADSSFLTEIARNGGFGVG